MGDLAEHNSLIDGEVCLTEAKWEAMERLPKLKRTLEYNGQNRSL